MSFRWLEWLIWTVHKCFATLTVKALCTHCNATVAFLFIILMPISDSLFCYLLHVLPVQKTTITSRESEIILLTVCTKTNWLRLRSWCCCRGGGGFGSKWVNLCVIYMPQPTTVYEHARYKDWSALVRKTQTPTPKQKGFTYRYKRKYKHTEVCTRKYHNAAHKVDFLVFKLPHRRVKCGGKLPLPVFVFYAQKSREIKNA